ncbi:unnamed protein product [Effrenium voratum]|uniref:SAM domain-containing protein n=1 Tax=Effrenium voratum TaxID=2562239 RepID=A0AA36JB30_9DINO|nr:unnamed protein product [Effrenium voratum]
MGLPPKNGSDRPRRLSRAASLRADIVASRQLCLACQEVKELASEGGTVRQPQGWQTLPDKGCTDSRPGGCETCGLMPLDSNTQPERGNAQSVPKKPKHEVPKPLRSPVGDFLSLLGIPRYAEHFTNLGLVSLAQLSRLSDEDLVKQMESITFLPGHQARLFRGVQALREASKARSQAMMARLCQRNQELVQQCSQKELQMRSLQDERSQQVERLEHYQGRNAELSEVVKTQGEQVRFLADKLQMTLSQPASMSGVVSSSKLRQPLIDAQTQTIESWPDDARDEDEQVLSAVRHEPCTWNVRPTDNVDAIVSSCAVAIQSKMRQDRSPDQTDQIFCRPGGNLLECPGQYEIEEFLLDTWDHVQKKTRRDDQQGKNMLCFAMALLLIYLGRMSDSERLILRVQNWQRILFTIMYLAAQALKLQPSSDIYSEEEIRSFTGALLHVTEPIAHADAEAALDDLHCSVLVQDLLRLVS